MKEETNLLLEKETKTQIKETKPIKQASVEKKEKEIAKDLFADPVDKNLVEEKPNFDKIEELSAEKREKIFKVEKQEQSSKKKTNKKLKLAILSICLVVLTAFCITTAVEIAKATQSLQAAQTEYSANLLKVVQKIYSTETGNRSLSLFETFPEEDLTASSFYETSNWFDRFCKFLTGLFGG